MSPQSLKDLVKRDIHGSYLKSRLVELELQSLFRLQVLELKIKGKPRSKKKKRKKSKKKA